MKKIKPFVVQDNNAFIMNFKAKTGGEERAIIQVFKFKPYFDWNFLSRFGLIFHKKLWEEELEMKYSELCLHPPLAINSIAKESVKRYLNYKRLWDIEMQEREDWRNPTQNFKG